MDLKINVNKQALIRTLQTLNIFIKQITNYNARGKNTEVEVGTP